jgi:hypothetical protein
MLSLRRDEIHLRAEALINLALIGFQPRLKPGLRHSASTSGHRPGMPGLSKAPYLSGGRRRPEHAKSARLRFLH